MEVGLEGKGREGIKWCELSSPQEKKELERSIRGGCDCKWKGGVLFAVAVVV